MRNEGIGFEYLQRAAEQLSNAYAIDPGAIDAGLAMAGNTFQLFLAAREGAPEIGDGQVWSESALAACREVHLWEPDPNEKFAAVAYNVALNAAELDIDALEHLHTQGPFMLMRWAQFVGHLHDQRPPNSWPRRQRGG